MYILHTETCTPLYLHVIYALYMINRSFINTLGQMMNFPIPNKPNVQKKNRITILKLPSRKAGKGKPGVLVLV